MKNGIKEWSDQVAAIVVDVLADHGIVKRADFEKATELVAEEIRIRLAINDYPPPLEQDAGSPKKIV
jgi:hypothetical protein